VHGRGQHAAVPIRELQALIGFEAQFRIHLLHGARECGVEQVARVDGVAVVRRGLALDAHVDGERDAADDHEAQEAQHDQQRRAAAPSVATESF